MFNGLLLYFIDIVFMVLFILLWLLSEYLLFDIDNLIVFDCVLVIVVILLDVVENFLVLIFIVVLMDDGNMRV